MEVHIFKHWFHYSDKTSQGNVSTVNNNTNNNNNMSTYIAQHIQCMKLLKALTKSTLLHALQITLHHHGQVEMFVEINASSAVS